MEEEHTMSKIVVVEDNNMNMKLIQCILEHAGYSIRCVQTAEEGMELIRSDKPEAIIMDIHLPGMDGLEATRIIKADPLLKDIKIMALTASAMAGDAERAINAGCDAYVSKPVRYKNFLEVLNYMLTQPSGKPD
jgi:two-component system, cell cycle response regulator DivK